MEIIATPCRRWQAIDNNGSLSEVSIDPLDVSISSKIMHWQPNVPHSINLSLFILSLSFVKSFFLLEHPKFLRFPFLFFFFLWGGAPFSLLLHFISFFPLLSFVGLFCLFYILFIFVIVVCLFFVCSVVHLFVFHSCFVWSFLLNCFHPLFLSFFLLYVYLFAQAYGGRRCLITDLWYTDTVLLQSLTGGFNCCMISMDMHSFAADSKIKIP